MNNKIKNILNELNSGLIEREQHIKEAVLTMLAGENLLLIGPPGTAKSEIARRLSLVIQDGNYYEYLLTKFTTPDELFGPLSISGLKEDKFERKTEGYLPNSTIAFLDETFKANSSILNSLLTIMNEKVFHNGSKKEKTEIISFIGASNELPKDNTELQALYDRFLTRVFIDYVSEDNRVNLLLSENKKLESLSLENRFKVEEVKKFHKDLEKVSVSQDMAKIIFEIHKEINEKFTDSFDKISDRRLKKSLKILKASALSNGRNEINVLDISLLSNMFWNDDENRDEVEKIVLGKLPSNDSQKSVKMNFIYETEFKKFENLGIQDNKVQKRDEQGNLLFLDRDGKETVESEREYDDSVLKENVHLQEKNGAYIYHYNYGNPNSFQLSTEKNAYNLEYRGKYSIAYTKNNNGKIILAQNENGEYIYISANNKKTHLQNAEICPNDSSYYRVVYDEKVTIPKLTKLQHKPILTDIRFILDDLEVLSEHTKAKVSEMETIHNEIEKNRDDISNSLNSHLWINREKLSFLKNSVETDFQESKKILEKFQELSDSLTLYFNKATENREHYKKSLHSKNTQNEDRENYKKSLHRKNIQNISSKSYNKRILGKSIRYYK